MTREEFFEDLQNNWCDIVRDHVGMVIDAFTKHSVCYRLCLFLRPYFENGLLYDYMVDVDNEKAMVWLHWLTDIKFIEIRLPMTIDIPFLDLIEPRLVSCNGR